MDPAQTVDSTYMLFQLVSGQSNRVLDGGLIPVREAAFADVCPLNRKVKVVCDENAGT